jgi:hypothetical protein
MVVEKGTMAKNGVGKEDVYCANAIRKLWITSFSLSLSLDLYGIRYFKSQGWVTNGNKHL